MRFPLGSIIKRRLDSFWGLFYCHMGIYVGDDEVIHFCGMKKKQRGARVRRDSLKEFADGQEVLLHEAPESDSHGRAVCRAAEHLYRHRHNGFDGRYEFAWNNCEDFCVACFEVSY